MADEQTRPPAGMRGAEASSEHCTTASRPERWFVSPASRVEVGGVWTNGHVVAQLPTETTSYVKPLQ